MGLKTIQAKREQAEREYESTFGVFVKDATRVNLLLAEMQKREIAIEKMQTEIGEYWSEAHSLMDKLNTHRIKQLEDIKKLLETALSHPHKRHPIKQGEITGLADAMKHQMKLDLQKMMDDYTNKLAASWPKEIKPGMVFKKLDEMVEIIEVSGIADWKVKVIKDWRDAGTKVMMAGLLSPQRGWKYLHG